MNNQSKQTSAIFKLVGPVFFFIALFLSELFLCFINFPVWMQAGALVTIPLFHIPDSQLGWRNKPGNYRLTDGKRVIEMNFNSDSTRKSSNTVSSELPNTILIGDSFMQGYGVSDQSTLGWLIQEKLPNEHIRNFGTAGYGTYQSYLALKKIISGSNAKKIRRIIYQFNDFHEDRNVGSPDWQLLIRSPSDKDEFHFPYAELTDSEPIRIKERHSNGLSPWRISHHLRSAALINSLFWQIEAMHRLSKKFNTTNMIINEMIELTKSHSFQLYIVFSRFTPEREDLYSKTLTDPSLRWVDCALPEQHDKAFRLEDGHPNEAMNQLTAKCILDSLANH